MALPSWLVRSERTAVGARRRLLMLGIAWQWHAAESARDAALQLAASERNAARIFSSILSFMIRSFRFVV